MTEETWAYSTWEESGYSLMGSRQSAIDEAIACGHTSFYLGKAVTPELNYAVFNFSNMIEEITDRNEELFLEDSEWCYDVPQELQKTLEEAVARTVKTWMEANGMTPKWFMVKDVEYYAVDAENLKE